MCFGGSSKPQVVSQGTTQVTDKSWETMEPYIKNALESSRARFEDQLATGFEAFPGGYEGRFEGPSQEELVAREGILQQGLSGIAGTGLSSARPYYEAGLSALSSSMDQFGPQQAQQYMNPYQQAVVDVAKREAVRQAQPIFRNIGDRAESTGAFGGSRQAIAEAEANRNLQQQLGDIQTRGMQSAFEQGRSAFEAQKAREAAASGRMFAQAPLAYRQGLAEMAAIEGVGQARRGDEQAKKDFLYDQFMEEKMYPSRVYDEHLGHVRGFSYQPSRYTTETASKPKASLGQQLMGGLGTAASIYGGMGGFGPGGFGKIFAEGGQVGGLASLASGGQIQGGGLEAHQTNVGNPFALAPMSGVMRNIAMNNPNTIRSNSIDSSEFEELLRKKRSGQPLKAEEEVRFQQLSLMEPGAGNLKNKNVRGSSTLLSPAGPTTGSLDQFNKLKHMGPQVDQFAVSEKGTLVGEKGGLSSLTDTGSKAKTIPANKHTVRDIVTSKIGELQGSLISDDVYSLDKKRNDLLGSIFEKDPQEEINKRIAGITTITSDYDKKLKDLIKDGDAHSKKQAKEWDKYQKSVETKIENREREQMGDLLARGKKAKESGEQKAMSNFWGLMAKAFAKAGTGPEGFLHGMLEGAEEGLDAFLDRHSDILDQYATGEEKRAREKMDIQDKRFNSLNDLASKAQLYKSNLRDKQNTLKQNMDKESAKVGASAAYKKLEAELSLTQKQIERAGLVDSIIGNKLELEKAERSDARDTIKVLTEWQDTITGTHGAGAGKAFSSNLTNLDKNVDSAFNFIIGTDGVGRIGNSEITDEKAQELARAKADVKRKFLSFLTTGDHKDQQEAMEQTFKYVQDRYTGGRGSGAGESSSGTQANPVDTSTMSQADLNALPSGTYIIHNGVVRKKR